ncbi:MAG: hypothetical protein HY898_34825 [Deltaproteobacteria bacterium]|nr:hypothetical protein [Deltaproteobacteria bacterium]
MGTCRNLGWAVGLVPILIGCSDVLDYDNVGFGTPDAGAEGALPDVSAGDAKGGSAGSGGVAPDASVGGKAGASGQGGASGQAGASTGGAAGTGGAGTGGDAGTGGAPAGCPNGTCDNGEDCNSCPADCGACCGNGACDNGEDCSSCAGDCGACCGNGACDNGEDCASCSDDCGACADAGLTDYPLPPIPAGCPLKAKILTYAPNGWEILADAFEADSTPCGDYFIFLPAPSNNKIEVRGPAAPQSIRARTGRFFAMAEFHWQTWEGQPGSWYDKGVSFRQKMDAMGYNIPRGDTWAINELPSSVRSDPAVRQQVRDAVRGLYTGAPGSPPRAGTVYVIEMGQATTNFGTYKPNAKSWMEDSGFWADMDKYVLYWGQETYTVPALTCVGGTTVADKSSHINDFVEHFGKLVNVGPSSVATARTFLNSAYFPLMNAWYKNGDKYGKTAVTSLDNMKHLVSHQTYAARAWADSHLYPDGRIGFAWSNNGAGTPAERTELAQRLASSIRWAYDINGTAAKACSQSGAYTWCQCDVAGAAFNDGWSTFESWN